MFLCNISIKLHFLALICATAQQSCTVMAHPASSSSSAASSAAVVLLWRIVHPYNSFSQISPHELMSDFGERHLSTISPDHFFPNFYFLMVFSSALCYCTAELLSAGGGPSSVRPHNPFYQNRSSRLMPNLVEWYLFTITPDHFVFKILHF